MALPAPAVTTPEGVDEAEVVELMVPMGTEVVVDLVGAEVVEFM
jgi:hypothetical protein